MSKNTNLYVEKTSYTKGSKTSLDNALRELWSHVDCDFIGENGSEYLSEKAEEYCIKNFGEDMIEFYSDFQYFTDITPYLNDEQYVLEFIKFYNKYYSPIEFILTGIHTDNNTSWLIVSYNA